MLTRIRLLLAPPIFEGDEDKTYLAGLLYPLLLIVLAAALLYPITLTIIGISFGGLIGQVILALNVLTLGLLVLVRLGYVEAAGVLLAFVLWLAFTILVYNFGGLYDAAVTGFFAVIILAALVSGGRILLLFTVLCIGALVGVYVAEQVGILFPSPSPSPAVINDLVLISLILAVAAILLRYAVRRMTEGYERARRSARALAESNRELEASRDALAVQTREVERRARYLEATAAVAHDTTSVLDEQQLLVRSVDLIGEQFGFYHVGLFVLDSEGEWAELQAASSEGGRRMLARGHRLRVGHEGVVGHVANVGQHRVVQEASGETVYFDNPDLPETRSELALPLQARGQVLGVLDVQSREPDAFGREDIVVLQSLADQLAMAIDNARLFQQVEESFRTERRAYGEMSSEAWREMLGARSELGFLSNERGTTPAGDLWEPQMEAAVQSGQATSGDGSAAPVAALSIPIKVRDQVIGVVDGLKPDGSGAWTQEEIELLEALTEQLNVALEGARLYQGTQSRAAREQLARQITDRMRRATDMDDLMQVTIREMANALGTSSAFVQLSTPGEPGDDKSQDRE